jgi:hypothetical protein
MNVDQLRALLTYDADTGAFTWRAAPPRSRLQAGAVAGCTRADRYVQIVVRGVRHFAHRLAWEFSHGAIPAEHEIDHIDHNPSNNTLANLRLVTKAENRRNRAADSRNKSGVNGVHWSRHANAWEAQIRSNRVSRHLGHFKNLEDAAAARKAAEQSLGFHPNHGMSQA